MKGKIKDYFMSRNIEYFAVLSYEHCREINGRLIERQGFEPKSAVIYLLPYYAGDGINLSNYASSLDYHLIISDISYGLEKTLREEFPDAKIKGYGDHSPINERHAALISGLGIAGDNGLIINERYGSYVFIGDILTDIEPQLIGAAEPLPIRTCEKCGMCRSACPTGILCGEGSECLSSITQRKGELSEEEKRLMRENNTLWGCDICQRVCPHNLEPEHTPVEFFYRDRIPELTSEMLDNMSDEDFKMRAFAWRKRKTVERNLEILFGNK